MGGKMQGIKQQVQIGTPIFMGNWDGEGTAGDVPVLLPPPQPSLFPCMCPALVAFLFIIIKS